MLTEQSRCITRIRGNIRGEIDEVVEGCTAFVGPVRTGKTSRLELIELALTGKHRAGVLPANLAKLMPSGAEELYAEVYGPIGFSRFVMEAPGGKPKRPKGVDSNLGDVGIVCDNISDIIGYGKDRARKYLAAKFLQGERVNVPLGLNKSQMDLWQEAQTAKHIEGDVAATLQGIADYLTAVGKESKTQVEGLTKLLNSIKAEYTDAAMGAEGLPYLEEQLEDARRAESQANQRQAQVKLQARLEALQSELGALDLTPVSGPTQDPDLSAKISWGRRVLQALTTDQCPVCKSETNLEEVRADYTAQIAELERRQASAQDLIQAQAAYNRRLSRAETLKEQIAGLEASIKDIEVEDYTGLSVRELEDTVQRFKTAGAMMQKAESLALDIERLGSRIEEAKMLATEANRQTVQMLTKIAQTVSDKVNAYIPEGFRANLQVTMSDIEWQIQGSDGRNHSRLTMSGSEMQMLMYALGMALVEDLPLKVLLLDDKDLGMLDPESLTLYLNKLKEAQTAGKLTNVFVVWNRPHEIPETWRIIHT